MLYHVNDADVVRFLLSEGAQVDHPDIEGSRPIHLACASGNLSCVRLLVAAGARIDCIDSKGRLPIHCLGVQEATDTPVVAAILDVLCAGADIAATTGQLQTLLQMACQHRKINALKAALLFGASLDLSEADATLLCVNCQDSQCEVGQTLLKYRRADGSVKVEPHEIIN